MAMTRTIIRINIKMREIKKSALTVNPIPKRLAIHVTIPGLTDITIRIRPIKIHVMEYLSSMISLRIR